MSDKRKNFLKKYQDHNKKEDFQEIGLNKNLKD